MLNDDHLDDFALEELCQTIKPRSYVPSTPASSLALVTIVVVLMGDGDRNRQRRYLGCIFVKLYPALPPHDGQTMADLLTLADPALWWKSTSLWLVGPCRLPGGGLRAACFILVRPLQTTVSPVMVRKLRPAGPKVTGSLCEAASCSHACGIYSMFRKHNQHNNMLTKVQHENER